MSESGLSGVVGGFKDVIEFIKYSDDQKIESMEIDATTLKFPYGLVPFSEEYDRFTEENSEREFGDLGEGD